MKRRQAARNSSRLKNEESPEESSDSEIAKNDSALERNVARRRRRLRARQSLDKSFGNEENRSQEKTTGSKILPNNTAVDENVSKGSVQVRRSLSWRQPLYESFGTEEDRSQVTTVDSNSFPNRTALDENVLKGLRPGWWRDLQDSHSTNAIHFIPSPILGGSTYDSAENPPQGWYQHLDVTEIPSFRHTSDTMTRSSGRESYPSPDTASSPNLHKRPLRQKIASVINVGVFQDAYDLGDSEHHSNTRSKPLQTSSHNSNNISGELESLSDRNTCKNNFTRIKDSNIVHSSVFLDTDESPVRSKRPLRRDSKFPSDYHNFDAVLESSDTEIQDAVISTNVAQSHSVNVSNNVEHHSVSRHDGVTEDGQSSPSPLKNTNLRIVGHRPFAQKKNEKSSLYKNLYAALEDADSPQGDEIHTKSNSLHSKSLSEPTSSPVKNSSEPLRKNRSVKLSISEDFTQTYEDDAELVQVKDGCKTIDGIYDNQKERADKSELEHVSNKDQKISYSKRSRKSIGSSILLHSTESAVPPLKKRLKMVRDYQNFEETLEDSDHDVTRRDEGRRSGQDELLLKTVASYEGPSNLHQVSEPSKYPISIEEESPTSGNVSPIDKMVYKPFAQKKGRKSSVYGGLELVLEDNSPSQTRVVPQKSPSLPSSVPSESSGSPSKKISGSPIKKVSQIFQKNKAVILLNERDLATAFEDNSSQTIDRNRSKRVISVDGDDNVASSTNLTVFEKSVQSYISSDTAGSPVRTNIRPFKKHSKIITDYQHFEEAFDISDSRASDKNKSRKSRRATGGVPSASGSSREAAMLVEQGSLKELSFDIQSSVSSASPASKMIIKPLMGKNSQKSSYKDLELALQEKSASKITTDDEDSKASGRNKSRRSRGITGAGPSATDALREAAVLVKEDSYEMQSSVSNASPVGKKSIKPLMGKKSRKSSYKDLELILQEKSSSELTTDDDDDDSKASGRNKSRRSRGITGTGPSASDDLREAANFVIDDSYEMQSSVSNASPVGENIKHLMGKKMQKSTYKDLESALQEKSSSKIITDNDDSKASGANKSRESRGTTGAGPSASDALREAADFEKEDSYEMQSSVSNASPAGKKSIKPLMGKKSRKSSYKDLELVLEEKSSSELTTDDDDTKASDRNKSRKSRGITGTGPSASDDLREAANFVNNDSYEMQSSVSNASPTGKKSIKHLMGKKIQKSSYKDLESALQEKSASKIITDDSKASDRNKSRQSLGTTGAGASASDASREAAIFGRGDSYEIEPSLSNTSPVGEKRIKPLMGKKSQKSSYKDLESALQEKSATRIITDDDDDDDDDDSKASGRSKSRQSRGTTGAGASASDALREAAVFEKEDSYEMQSSVSNASPAGKKSIKPLMGKKSRKSFYKDLESALQEKSATRIITDDSKASGRNKSRQSLRTTGAGASPSDALREAAISGKGDSYEMQSSVSNASPTGKKSIKPLMGKKSQKSSFQDLELALEEKSASKIITDDDDSKVSGRSKSRQSRGTTGAGPSASDALREAADFEKEDSYEMQSSVSNASPAGKKSIKPLMGKKSQKSSFQDLELALEEKSASKIITDDDDSKVSGRSKSRQSRGTTGAGPSASDALREAADFEKEDSYEMQSSVSNASPAGKKSIKPLMGKKSRKSSYKDLELVLEEKSSSKIINDDDDDDSKASGRNKSRQSRGPSASDALREAADFEKEDSYEMQSSVSNASPAGKKSIKLLMGKKSRKSLYKDLELVLEEKSSSELATDDDDTKASGRNKSRKSRGITDTGPSASDDLREAANFVNDDSYEMQSSVSNASPTGKKSIKPLMGKKMQKSSHKDLESALQEKSESKIAANDDDDDDSRASGRNKFRKSRGTTGAEPLASDALREAANLVKEDSYEMHSSVSNSSPAGKLIIKPLMRKKSRKSSYKDLELALQEKSASKIATDDNDDDDDVNDYSKASGANKSRKSRRSTGAGLSASDAIREAAIFGKGDSYEIEPSVSNASPVGERSIKPLMGKKIQKSSYKDLESALQEKSASKIITDDDSKASDRNKSRQSLRTTGAGPSASDALREAAISGKGDSYEMQSSVSNASPAGKKNIKPLMGKKNQKSLYKDLELALEEESSFIFTTDDKGDFEASNRNKSRNSRGTTGAGPSPSGTSEEAAIFVEQDSFKEDLSDVESSENNASPAGNMSIKRVIGRKSRKSSYKNLELALQEEFSSQIHGTPRKSSSMHSSHPLEISKSSVRNLLNIFPKNKSVILSGSSIAFEGVLQLSDAVQGTKSKKESDSFQTNILENSRNLADLHKNKVSERSISSNTPSNTTEPPLQTVLTSFQKNTKLASGYQDLNESLEDSNSSMFDRGKITRSKTSTQLEHHERSSITPDYSVRVSSRKEMAEEMELSSAALNNISPISKMRHQQQNIRKSSIDENEEYSHKSEVHGKGSLTHSILPPESSGSPIKTPSKPFQKNKSVLPSYEGDLGAIFEYKSSQDRLYNRQLQSSVNNASPGVNMSTKPLMQEKGPVEEFPESSVTQEGTKSNKKKSKSSQEKEYYSQSKEKNDSWESAKNSAASHKNQAVSFKYVPSSVPSDTAEYDALTNLFKKNPKHRSGSDESTEDNSSIFDREESRKSRPTEVLRTRSVTFRDIDDQEDTQELRTILSHKEGADEIQSSSSLNHNSADGKMTRQPFTQKVRKSSVYKSSESFLEQNALPSRTNAVLKEDTPLLSGLPPESSGSPTKMVSKISEKNKSIILSNEGDLAAAFEVGSYADSDDIESSQDRLHDSQLSGSKKNVFPKQSKEISAKNSSSMNRTVSDSLVQSTIPSDNTGPPIADNQYFERIFDSTSARNKSRKSDQVQQESVRRREMYNLQPSVSNASPGRNMSLMQNSQKSSVSKSLKFAVEENTLFPQTSKFHGKSTSVQSNLSSEYSESPNKKFAKLVQDPASSDISVEITSEEETYFHADIELPQDRQHSSNLRVMNENPLYLKQDNTNMKRGHKDSVSSDDTVKISPRRKSVKQSHSNRVNTGKNTSDNKMPSSQVLVKPSEELEISSFSNSDPVPVANSTAFHSPTKKMKYIAATISDAGGSSSLAERNSHIPSPKQRSFVQNNETSENFPFMRKDESRVKKDSSTDPHHSSGLLAIENDPGNKDKSKGDPFEPSPIVRTNIKKSISRFRMSKEKKNEVGKPPIKTTSESLLCKSIIFPVGTKNTDKENLLSLPAKGRTNNVSGLSQSLQKNQDLGKAKEMNQERMNQIEENLRKEQKKPRTIQEYIEALKMAENQKPKKPPKPKPPIDPDFLVNGKVYRPPPFKKPKPWVTKQLINTLLKHCEKKYGPIRKRRKAEDFLVVLCKEVSNAIRRPKNYLTSVENTKRMLYKFGLIKNLHEFYCFIEDYLPPEFRYKAIPCLRAFGKTTGPPWIPGTNIFLELEFD